jgi:hypothetical protein
LALLTAGDATSLRSVARNCKCALGASESINAAHFSRLQVAGWRRLQNEPEP